MTTLNQRPTRKDMSFGAQGDLGGYTFTLEELEQAVDQFPCNSMLRKDLERATAEYHMYKDMSAMAARIDQLLAENDRLQKALTKEYSR